MNNRVIQIETTNGSSTSSSKMKYQQLVDHINDLIQQGLLSIGDRLPSLKQLEKSLGMSKETVLKGLNHLIETGIIESVYRKGYFVRKTSMPHAYRICLLLDKMNLIRDTFYHSLFDILKEEADIDIYFHHHNFKVFSKLIQENVNSYTHFVVATFLKEDPTEILNAIPSQKRIIIDFDHPDLAGGSTSIYQDFEADIYDSLTQVFPKLKKYKRFILIAPHESNHAHLIAKGFMRFCNEHKLQYIIQHEIIPEHFKKGNLYVTFGRYDTEEVALIKLLRQKGYTLGSEIGLISYNNTAVKEILEGGLTVIAPDFQMLAEEVANAIRTKQPVRKRIPVQIILRNSV